MLHENYKVVPILADTDVGASTDADSVLVSGANWISVLISCGAFTGNLTLSFNSGTTNGAKTNAVPFKYALGSAAIGATTSDVFAAWTAATTTAAITCTTKAIAVEIDPADITAGDLYLTGTFAATAGICHAFMVIQPRYAKGESTTLV